MSDPNVSALSSEVEQAIEEAEAYFSGRGPVLFTVDGERTLTKREVLRDLVRKALGTVEADLDDRNGKLHAEWEVRWKERTEKAESSLAALREQARALAEALREVDDHFGREYWTSDDGTTQRHGTPEDNECPRGTGELWRRVRAALASWDTSQKESR